MTVGTVPDSPGPLAPLRHPHHVFLLASFPGRERPSSGRREGGSGREAPGVVGSGLLRRGCGGERGSKRRGRGHLGPRRGRGRPGGSEEGRGWNHAGAGNLSASLPDLKSRWTQRPRAAPEAPPALPLPRELISRLLSACFHPVGPYPSSRASGATRTQWVRRLRVSRWERRP